MTAAWTGADEIRAMRQVQRIYDCGPRSCYELLRELAADPIARVDLDALLERYGRLTPAMIAWVDARDLRLPLVVIEGDSGVANSAPCPMRGAA